MSSAITKTSNTTATALYDCEQCLFGKCRDTVGLSHVTCICNSGYEGSRCQNLQIIDLFNHGHEDRENPELIAGIVVASFVFVIILIVAVIVWRRYRMTRKNKRRRLSLQEGFKKKMSIEGVSIIEEKSPSKSSSACSIGPPPYKEVNGNHIKTAYMPEVTTNDLSVARSTICGRSEINCPNNCHENKTATMNEDAANNV